MATVLAGLSLLANLLQVMTSGSWGSWLALVLVVTILVLLVITVSPLFRRGLRKSALVGAIRRTGLTDIEHRSDPMRRVAPQEIIRSAQGPVLISGILDQLFQQHRDAILRFVAEDRTLRVLLVHPKKVLSSLEHSWAGHDPAWANYWRTNCNEAQIALDGLIEADLHRHPRVEVRFMTELPPYFGILVGDLNTSSPIRQNPYVRVQPLAVSQFVGRGTVVTFERIADCGPTPFDYFSEDLNSQWTTAILDDGLIQQRMATLQLSQQQ